MLINANIIDDIDESIIEDESLQDDVDDISKEGRQTRQRIVNRYFSY